MGRLCRLPDGFKGAIGLSLAHMVLQGLPEDRELAVGLEPAEGLLGLQHTRCGPPQRHLGIAPAPDVAADLSDRAQRVLDDVGAGERAPEFVRQAETDDGEDLVQPLKACCPPRPVPHAPGAGPGCAAAVRPSRRHHAPRPGGSSGSHDPPSAIGVPAPRMRRRQPSRSRGGLPRSNCFSTVC